MAAARSLRERHVTRPVVGDRNPRREGWIADRVGRLCLPHPRARLAHCGQCLTTVDAAARRRRRQPPALVADGAGLRVPHRRRYAGAGPGHGTFEVQTGRGILGVRADGAEDDKTVGTINLDGSIVAIGGEVVLSRPVDDGVALVKVPNSRGVRVLVNNIGGTHRETRIPGCPRPGLYLSSPSASCRMTARRTEAARSRRTSRSRIAAAPTSFRSDGHRASTGSRRRVGKHQYGTSTVTAGGALQFSARTRAAKSISRTCRPAIILASPVGAAGTCRVTIHMPDKAAPMTDAGILTCVEGPQ